ncbi:MAG: PH domain-containing protein [Candidatus Andersenbacteria bacterium]
MHEPTALFPGQRSDEQVLIFTRRHWIQILASTVFVVLMVAAYLAALFVILRVAPIDFTRGIPRLVLVTVSGIVLLMAWLFMYVKFIDYYLDIWILTNERIVQIKQRSLFNRQITELDLSTVQDVQSRVKGILATFLGYGTIFVQTAGTTELLEFRYIPKPYEVEKHIIDRQTELEERTKREISGAVRTGQPITDQQIQRLGQRLPDID